jgi:Domain of unknown function (DUF6867)
MNQAIPILGAPLGVTLGLTVIFMGGCALMMGRALALSWRPAAYTVFYAALLGLADRFLIFALFQGNLLSLSGYLLDTDFFIVVAALTYRITLASRVVAQYPWLYQRSGPFGWRHHAHKKP